ncbi:lipopolysaccharide assembly protein LapB [Niallia sp. NCCP-28]|uniref:tetratricopeptide repeat protein n=1 Tax=Niallia sp. NCCP-28 TaxID=2934712 RepID=UPI0020875657|nr:tetratricopeptide repeat protein [Niallia sp. NCCP-28]GKU81473.1 TPR repeat-containing protein YsoA [Niallia sp. NCCP-28]
MSKRDKKKKDNIVLFPDLDQRFLEKGLQSIQEKSYYEAVSFFKEALSLNPTNSEVQIGLILAYYELGSLHHAKDIAKNMLQSGLGDYIHVLDLYLMILVQLHEYEEIVATIEVLLEEHRIPAKKLEHFSKMLDFSRRMALSTIKKEEGDENHYIEEEDNRQKLNLYSLQNSNEQMQCIAKLHHQNVRPYIEEIKGYLADENSSPFLKTLLLNILKEQEYDKEIAIHKLNQHLTVIPSELEEMGVQSQKDEIWSALIHQLEHEDPVLLEHIMVLLEQQFFLLYPLKLERYSNPVWAAGYHYVIQSYFDPETKIGDYMKAYEVDRKDLMGAIRFIKSLEEISYPNI